MKRRKKVLAVLLTASLCSAMGISVPKVMNVKADGMKVVTLGQDLSKEQQDKIMKYFGANYDEVELLYINNQQEREALGSYIPLSQIGTHTYSCAMVKPTSSGGIQVKTANLNYVTCNMIASTLTTSGVTNCQVLAAAPFEVSGTGALTGITLAYEKATDTTLDPVKKDLANQEMVVTGGIAEELGQSAATAVVNETKENVIEGNVTEIGDINNIVNNVTNEYNVEMNDEDKQKLAELMQKIAEQDYDIAQIKANLDKVQANVIDDTSASEDKKTEVVKQAEASAEEAQRVAQEAQNLAQSSTAGTATEEQVEGSVEVPTDSDGNILDSTDSSAFGDANINEGTTTETVTDQQTTGSDTEETKQTGEGDVWNETSGTFDGAEHGTEQVTEQNTADTENTETQTTEGETVDGSVEVPEGTENTGDTESTPTEEPKEETATEEQATTDGASDELTADVKEVYDNLDKAFEGNVITDSNGVSVYLPEATVTDMKTNILNRYAEILLSGVDTPVSDDEELQAKYDTALDDTKDMAEVKEYKDEKLVAMDKYLRYYVLENAPKQFDDSNLVDSDKVAVYEAAIKVFEEKFGEASTEETDGTTETVSEEGSAETGDVTTEESVETEGTDEVADTEVAE